MMKTDAYKNFESNLTEVTAMFKLMMPPSGLQQRVEKLTKKAERQLQDERLVKIPFRVRRLASDLEAFRSDVEDYVRGRVLVQDWISAILVTVVLTYLEDGFALLATKNPRLFAESDPLDINRVLEAASIEDLRADLRKQWASKTLLGGPKKWLLLLRRLGAKDYKPNCVFRLQHLWDTRNLIVHGRGIATAVYVRNYPKPEHVVGARIHVNTGVLDWWFTGISEFVEATDEFFQRYGERRAKEPAG